MPNENFVKISIISIFIIFMIINTINGGCVFQINELFVDDDIEEGISQDFIEITSDCTNEKIGIQEGLALMIIGNESPTLLYYLEFKIDIVEHKQLFVIGNDDIVPNINFIAPPFPYESEHPLLILLFNSLSALDKSYLNLNQLNEVPMSTQQIGIVINRSIDGFLISKYIFNVIEGFYENIIPKWDDLDFYVTYYNDRGIFQYQQSLNRCFTGAFDIQLHQISQTSPGLENICVIVEPDEEYDITKGLELLESNVDKDQQNIVKDSLENVLINDPIWPNTENFKNEWIDKIKSRHDTTPSLLKIFETEAVKESIIYLDNVDKPSDSTFRCNSCYWMSKQFNPLVSVGNSDICKEKGSSFRARARETKDKISQHLESISHINVISALTSSPEKRIKLVNEDPNLKATVNLFHWVYIETLAGVSYRAHELLTKGIKKLGIEIGTHNINNAGSMKITKFISDKMHESFINYLVHNNAPFSILMDGSTDNFGFHGLLIFFQYIEKNRPILKLYRYIEIKDASAMGQFNALKRSFESESNPGFVNYVKMNLKAITVDGVSSNIANVQSVWRYLENYINTGTLNPFKRPLIYYHCSSHRLALAYNGVIFNKNPISQLEYTKLLFKNANRLQKFYNTQSYKRRGSLVEDAKEEDEKVRMFSKLFMVRWLPSSHTAYDIILINYKIFMQNLDKIKNEISHTKYPSSVRQEAETILLIFSHKNTLITYVHHLDILFTLTKFAKKLQKKAGTIIELKKWYFEMIRDLNKLKTIYGPNLKLFLSACKCNNRQGCSTLEIFESEEKIIYKNVELHETDIDDIFPKLSLSRAKIIEILVEELQKRFPDNTIEAFSIFNPRDLGTYTAAQLQSTIDHFKKYYNFNIQETRNSITKLIRSVTDSNFYKEYKHDSPEVFWPNALYKEGILWDDLTRNIIKTALVQSIGTSAVESGFSQLSYIKNKWRSRLSIKSAESQLRLKFNGVGKNKIFELNLVDVARKWLNEGHIRSDSNRRPRTKHTPNRVFLPSRY